MAGRKGVSTNESDVHVCPRCGVAKGTSRWCSGCGLNLELAGDLPTSEEYAAAEREKQWLARQAEREASAASAEPVPAEAATRPPLPPTPDLGSISETPAESRVGEVSPSSGGDNEPPGVTEGQSHRQATEDGPPTVAGGTDHAPDGTKRARLRYQPGVQEAAADSLGEQGQLALPTMYRGEKSLGPESVGNFESSATALPAPHKLTVEQLIAYQDAIEPLAAQIVAAYVAAIETAPGVSGHLVAIIRKPKVTDLRWRLDHHAQAILKLAQRLKWPEEVRLQVLSPDRTDAGELERRLEPMTSLPGSQFWPREGSRR